MFKHDFVSHNRRLLGKPLVVKIVHIMAALKNTSQCLSFDRFFRVDRSSVDSW